jgi:predicted N-acyltransferase
MSQSLSPVFLDSIADISSAEWNGLLKSNYPFLRHEFLLALERSGSVSAASGWQSKHLLLRDSHGKLLALMPLYLKSHSMGEYVFDWSWADAYHRHGLNYYPKLVTAIPFTPSRGPRICFADGQDQRALLQNIFKLVQNFALSVQASSWHMLFPEQEKSDQLLQLGMQQRIGCQYQWFNRSYTSFDHFLESFSSRKRKNIKKERRHVEQSEIEFEWLEGDKIQTEHWQRFYRFYQNTYLIRGRSAYLNLPFFLELARLLPDQILLIMARKAERYIAGALCFKDESTLYGRYWGCDEEWQFLHFETCYYQGLEYCINHQLQRFDSGAQGEHKIQRGFEPVTTYSNHWISHPEFSAAIEHFLDEEKQHLQQYQRYASDHLPFKKEGN